MSFKDLKTKASELFEVGPSILIQRFDKDFEEFVDVEQYSEIQNSDKLKVIVHEKQQNAIANKLCDSPDVQVRVCLHFISVNLYVGCQLWLGSTSFTGHLSRANKFKCF